MPPASAKKTLTAAEKALLKRWIVEGAEYQRHWAFVVPKLPPVPPPPSPPYQGGAKGGWVRNPIDRFLLARMEKEGLQPSPEADRYTLARRLALDLTGLPPTWRPWIASSPTRARMRMRSSSIRCCNRRPTANAGPRSGSTWPAMPTPTAMPRISRGRSGSSATGSSRRSTRIMPFDQFTIEQIAGDMLPNPTPDQIIATAFHRNTLTNTEGGTNDEEFRNIAVVDRVNTTLQVWMGLSMACAQCHDHKYDPISQEEYFRVFAIFNQSEDSDKGDNSPNLLVITPAERPRRKRSLEAKIADAGKGFAAAEPGSTTPSRNGKKEGRPRQAAGATSRRSWPSSRPSETGPAAEVAKYLSRRRCRTSRAPPTRSPQRASNMRQVKPVPTPIMRELPAAQAAGHQDPRPRRLARPGATK